MSTPNLLFIGHISLDRIRNMWGERTQVGGAALYAAMGAKTLSNKVRVISSVGKDFNYVHQIYSTLPSSLIKRVNLPTTSFTITYDAKFRATYLDSKLGSGKMIRVADLPPSWLCGDEYVHLSPMHPPKVQKFVERIRKISPSTWISVNSCIEYMKSHRNRRILKDLADDVDLFIVNEEEAMALAEDHSISSAAHRIKGRRIAITLGELGAVITEDGRSELIPALSGITMKPRDTTGAGDTWCGALVASYALTKDWTKSVVTACIVSALKCLDWGFDAIKDIHFNHPDELVDHVLKIKEGSRQLSLRKFIN
ncbi:MAG: carbohydrate kinase family protein [Candidatus Bathyarchaeia archaeon]